MTLEPYYYRQMDKAAQAAYHAMKTGITALRPSFSVPKLDGPVLSEIFFKLRLDCPEIFYVTGFSYRYAHGAENVELVPEYLFDKKKVQEHQKALTARVEKLARPARTLSPLEKERYIHDFLCTNVCYDKLKKPYSHEIIGPLGQGVGVCEGIAKSVKILCDALGLPCVIAISRENPEQGVKYRHAWNILTLPGGRRHLDATFDLSLSGDGIVRYDYFNLTDEQLFRDHQPLVYPAPVCTGEDLRYYRENKLSLTRMEDVQKRCQMPLRKGLPFVFHWRGGYLTRQVLLDLTALLEQEAARKGKHAAVSFNWPQAVIQVRFVETLPQAEPRQEEANEGEQYPGE